MGDPVAGAQAAKKLLAEDGRLRKKIFAHAYSLTHNVASAKELAQEGMARVIDPGSSPWDRVKQPNLLLWVGSLMNTLAANKRRGDARHPTMTHEPDKDLRVDPEPTPEERTAHSGELAGLQHWMDQLLVRLAGDDVALGKIELLYDGVEDAAEQAARLHCEVADIYRANERIAYHANLVKKTGRDPTPPASPEVGRHLKPRGGPEAEG